MLKQALKDMFVSFNFKDEIVAKVYFRKLLNSGLGESFLVERLNVLSLSWKPQYGRKIPSVSEIIGVSIEAKEIGEIESAWQIFKKNMCNNLKFEPIPKWVYTIKVAIGVYEVENMKPETEKWVKKEFMRIFPAIKSGAMKVLEDKNKYLTDGDIIITTESMKYFKGNFKELESSKTVLLEENKGQGE